MSYIFLDTETHAKENPILIQLAYIRETSIGVAKVNEYFNTGGPMIEFGAMAVHHITEKMIGGKKRFDDSLERDDLISILLSGAILVAHNASFDVGVLKNHNVLVPDYICTLKLARYIYPEFEAHNLQYLRYRLGLEFDNEINPHDAMSDVYVLEKLFYHLSKKFAERLAAEINNYPRELNEDTTLIQRMIEITRAPSLLYRCVFGKHAGKLWSEVPRDYLMWIVDKSDMSDEDVMHTARYYLSGNTSLPV